DVSKVGRKKLHVLFNPRFVTCNDKQHIDLKKSEETSVKPQIDCTYSGNPRPQIEWQKANHEKLIDQYNKDSINIVEETLPSGVYKSIVKFNRQKLDDIQNGMADGDKSYFQKLVADGFVVKLNSNLTKVITVVITEEEKIQLGDAASQAQHSWMTFLVLLIVVFHLFV
ncbi:unnamed protein product, partial [Didymodactylos carnosus]